MLLRWLQQQELTDEHTTWWLMKIVLERGLLKLKNNMYILLGFLWHKQWHGVHNFHFLDIFKVLIGPLKSPFFLTPLYIFQICGVFYM
jgi:hypothetical protein